MFDLIDPVFGFMVCTLLLGVILGWAVWGFGVSKKEKTLASEVEFWQANLNEVRMKRGLDLSKIDTLMDEKETLKKRLASKKA